MCQISVVVAREDGEERLMDNVTGLEVTGDGVVLTAFFEEPKAVPGVVIDRIDFLGGKVFLVRQVPGPHLRKESEEKGHG